jgi:fibronectin-binding autotransporter adhesin
VIADAGVGAYRQSGGTATFAGKLTIANNFTASGTFALNGGSAVVRGEIDVGVGATTSGEFDFNVGGGSATLAGANANGPNFKIGRGGTGVLNDGAGTLKGASVAVGTENGGSGLVNVFGAGAAFSMTTLSVGSFESGNSPAGGVGTLVVSDGGYLSVAKTLALNDFASADTNLQETFSGGIYLSGGALEIGGSKGGLSANTLQIDAGGVLSGHGLIQGGNDFNVTISMGGRLEAKDGLLVISGDVKGSGTIQIDNGATVKIAGLELDRNLTVTFQSGGTGTLIRARRHDRLPDASRGTAIWNGPPERECGPA